ncbi:MAG TPA: peptidylprolyl isomerase [Candidatus Polarisedimenticolaceae bacterium]|nr:peptidylprolyl isomerase [Candidatus Polarisedimenticolaceae bacterium]
MRSSGWLLLAVALAASAAPLEGDDFVPPPGLTEGWYVRIDTSFGRIVARLLPDQAPQSVAHFAALASGRLEWTDPVTGVAHREPYYDGVRIHKAVAGQRFEAGDRTGTGRGALQLFVPYEGQGPVTFDRPGRLGMTASGARQFSAVQFFVTSTADRALVGRQPCFGEVLSGMDVIEKIATVKTFSNGRPMEPVTIERIRVFPVGQPAALPEPREFVPQRGTIQLREGKRRVQP